MGPWRGGFGWDDGRGIWVFLPSGGGGGLSGTCEQFGMRPTCDPTVRTTPCPSRGQGIIGLGIPSHTGNLRGLGS